jgi:tetratricopeptide (TPR) repeat protein
MQLDPGSFELGDMGVLTLAFSPDGKQLLAGGVGGCAFWSTAPIVWNDPVRAAEKLRLLLQSNADFLSRIRMLSGHARLDEALEKLDKLVPNDERVQIALAVAQARRFAAQGKAALPDEASTKARKLLEEKLAKEPDNPAWAAELADVLLMFALADHRRGETDQARKACRQAAEMLKRAGGANATLRPLLHETVLALGIESPEAKELIGAAAGEPPAALNEAIRQNPDQAQGYRDRGNWHAERGRSKEAIADYAEVFRLDPNTWDGLHLGILLAWSGETARYREHGQAMLKRWALTEKNGGLNAHQRFGSNSEADHTLQTVVLLPGYKADAEQLARLAEAAVAGDPSRDWYEWWLHAKALYDLRTGRYADAVTACRASRQRAPQSKGNPELLTALDLVIEALALQGAGKADEARRTLEQAKPLVESYVPGIDGTDWWSDWLAAHMLYREAEALIAATKTGK